MKKTASVLRALCLLLVLLPWASQAANLGFLKNSLLQQLTGDDITSLKQEVTQVLNKTPDQKIIRWRSANNKIQVQILPKLSFMEGERECRRTVFKFTADQRRAEYYRFDICKDSEGRWQVSDSLMRKTTDSDWKLLEDTVKEVLESARDNRLPASWFNPESNNAGVVVPVSVLSHEGNFCRELAISIINAKGGTMDGHYTFCKKNGQWERLGQ